MVTREDGQTRTGIRVVYRSSLPAFGDVDCVSADGLAVGAKVFASKRNRTHFRGDEHGEVSQLRRLAIAFPDEIADVKSYGGIGYRGLDVLKQRPLRTRCRR